MNFHPGDIVVIEKHALDYVIGRSAEVKSGPHPAERCAQLHPLLPALAPGEAWYVLIDVAGQRRAAAHSWLRRAPDAWEPTAYAERLLENEM